MNDSHLSGQRAPRAEEPKRKNGEDKAGSSDDGGWDRDSEPGAAGRAPGKRDRKTSKRKAATGPGLVRGEGPGGRVTCSREGPGGPVTCSPFRPASPPAPRSPLLPLGEESKRVSGDPTAPRPEKRVRALPHPPSRPAAQPFSHPFAPPPPGHGVGKGGGSWLRSCWWRGITRLCGAGGGQGRWGWGARSCPPRGERAWHAHP